MSLRGTCKSFCVACWEEYFLMSAVLIFGGVAGGWRVGLIVFERI